MASGGESLTASAVSHVDELDHQAERHREVHVAPVEVLSGSLGHQEDPNHHQEGQREDLDARVLLHEIAEGGGEDQHDDEGENHRHDHHFEVLDHSHGGDDRVQGKDDVEEHDLSHDPGELSSPGRASRFHFGAKRMRGLDLVVDFERGLGDEEEPPEDEEQVATAHRAAHYGEER